MALCGLFADGCRVRVLPRIDDVSAILSGVRHDVAEPEGNREDCDDPERMEGEPEEAK